MRILFDLQTLYTNEKKRGIGIFTFHWIKSLITEDKHNRYYGYRKDFKSEGWEFVLLTTNRDLDEIIDNDYLWVQSDFNQFIEENNIDLINMPSPLMSDIRLPPSLKKKVIKTCMVHDLIPYVLKDIYFNKWSNELQKDYLNKLENIKQMDKIVTNSVASKEDLVNFLGILPDKIKVIYESINEELFKPINNLDVYKVTRELGIQNDFIFTLTGADPRKNNSGIINAFSRIADKNKKVDLVIGGIRGEEKDSLYDEAEKLGISDQVKILDYISNDHLLALYNCAKVFVFISLYEGFGLPVLEAMRCGTPVIISNTSSLPEVVGPAGILVDPNDITEIANQMNQLLSDKQLRENMSKASLQQAQKFSWEKVVQETFSGLEIFRPAYTNGGKKQLALLSPFNPQQSGISDYSEELIPYLSQYFDIKIFVDGFDPTNEYIKKNLDVYDINKNLDIIERIPYRLYHMGNNLLHEPILKVLKDFPGHVVLHDYNIYGFYMYSLYLKGDKKRFREEMLYSHNFEGEQAILDFYNNHQYPNDQNFPMCQKVADLSTGLIVHSMWVKTQCQKYHKSTNCVHINHGVKLNRLDSEEELLKIRESLKLSGQKGPFIGAFGNVRPNKRVGVLLKAFSKLLWTHPDAMLLIVGYCDDEMSKELKQIIKELDVSNNVIITGGTDFDLFHEYIKAIDICINLRWPTMGETSGALLRSMAAGKPSIVSNINQYKEYPDNCCWKVDPDEYEEDLLLAYLIELCSNKALRKCMSDNAYSYIGENYNFEKVANEYFDFITK